MRVGIRSRYSTTIRSPSKEKSGFAFHSGGDVERGGDGGTSANTGASVNIRLSASPHHGLLPQELEEVRDGLEPGRADPVLHRGVRGKLRSTNCPGQPKDNKEDEAWEDQHLEESTSRRHAAEPPRRGDNTGRIDSLSFVEIHAVTGNMFSPHSPLSGSLTPIMLPCRNHGNNDGKVGEVAVFQHLGHRLRVGERALTFTRSEGFSVPFPRT